MLSIIEQGIISRIPERGAYMPIISELSDGTKIACQHVGNELGSPDNHIEVLRSTDGEKSWVNEGSIHGQEEGGQTGIVIQHLVSLNIDLFGRHRHNRCDSHTG